MKAIKFKAQFCCLTCLRLLLSRSSCVTFQKHRLKHALRDFMPELFVIMIVE